MLDACPTTDGLHPFIDGELGACFSMTILLLSSTYFLTLCVFKLCFISSSSSSSSSSSFSAAYAATRRFRTCLWLSLFLCTYNVIVLIPTDLYLVDDPFLVSLVTRAVTSLSWCTCLLLLRALHVRGRGVALSVRVGWFVQGFASFCLVVAHTEPHTVTVVYLPAMLAHAVLAILAVLPDTSNPPKALDEFDEGTGTRDPLVPRARTSVGGAFGINSSSGSVAIMSAADIDEDAMFRAPDTAENSATASATDDYQPLADDAAWSRLIRFNTSRQTPASPSAFMDLSSNSPAFGHGPLLSRAGGNAKDDSSSDEGGAGNEDSSGGLLGLQVAIPEVSFVRRSTGGTSLQYRMIVTSHGDGSSHHIWKSWEELEELHHVLQDTPAASTARVILPPLPKRRMRQHARGVIKTRREAERFLRRLLAIPECAKRLETADFFGVEPIAEPEVQVVDSHFDAKPSTSAPRQSISALVADHMARSPPTDSFASPSSDELSEPDASVMQYATAPALSRRRSSSTRGSRRYSSSAVADIATRKTTQVARIEVVGNLHVTVDVPSWRHATETEGGAVYVAYTIVCTFANPHRAGGHAEFTVDRRYSEFAKLHSLLARRYPKCVLPNLPPKKLRMDKLDVRHVDARRRLLIRYIKELLATDFCQTPEVSEFLDLPELAAQELARHPWLAGRLEISVPDYKQEEDHVTYRVFTRDTFETVEYTTMHRFSEFAELYEHAKRLQSRMPLPSFPSKMSGFLSDHELMLEGRRAKFEVLLRCIAETRAYSPTVLRFLGLMLDDDDDDVANAEGDDEDDDEDDQGSSP